ncbi:MAG: molybdate ABC transporter substrate-binding protein [Paenibacillaceae bacterium]
MILVLVLFTGCADDHEQSVVELTISAAASLSHALEEIQNHYESEHENIRLSFNFGASGVLQQQIEQGAPADIFLSAASINMRNLVDRHFIDESQQHNLLMNELVVIIPADGNLTVHSMDDLSKSDIEHVAMGEPQTVPAGSYAKEALTTAKLWDNLQSRIVLGKDVRQVLTYVESGNAEAGFVYQTDALASKNVIVAFHVDPTTYTPIEYPVGIVKATKHSNEALDFYMYLQSQQSQDVFLKYGFSVPK